MQRIRRWVLGRSLGLAVLCACALPAPAQDAVALIARHAALRDTLAHNAFGQPLVLESSEARGRLTGDILARIDRPFARLADAIQRPAQWCDILILHLNVKQCRVGTDGAAASIGLRVGQTFDQPLADTQRFDFSYTVAAREADYLQVVLAADQGPLGTGGYRIVLEAAPLDGQRSVLHLTYAYDQGLAAQIAVQGYLATRGRRKVGFSVIGRQADGAPIYIGNVRGLIERNTMRYYLAIEAYLGALDVPPVQQLAKRLNDWHSGVERYPRQLHELEREEYLVLKQGEVRRQQDAGG